MSDGWMIVKTHKIIYEKQKKRSDVLMKKLIVIAIILLIACGTGIVVGCEVPDPQETVSANADASATLTSEINNKNTNTNTNMNVNTVVANPEVKVVTTVLNKNIVVAKNQQTQLQVQDQAQFQGQEQSNQQEQKQMIKCPEGYVPILGGDGNVYFIPDSVVKQNQSSSAVGMKETGFNFVPFAASFASILGGMGIMAGAMKWGLIK